MEAPAEAFFFHPSSFRLQPSFFRGYMTCTVCRSKNREQIDIALIDGVPVRTLALRTRLGKDALHRHKAVHLPRALAQSKRAQELANSDNLLDRLNALYADAQNIKTTCIESSHLRTALMGVRELARLIEILARIQSAPNRKLEQDIINSAEWITIRTIIMQALEPYQDAREAVAKALIRAARETESGATVRVNTK